MKSTTCPRPNPGAEQPVEQVSDRTAEQQAEGRGPPPAAQAADGYAQDHRDHHHGDHA